MLLRVGMIAKDQRQVYLSSLIVQVILYSKPYYASILRSSYGYIENTLKLCCYIASTIDYTLSGSDFI